MIFVNWRLIQTQSVSNFSKRSQLFTNIPEPSLGLNQWSKRRSDFSKLCIIFIDVFLQRSHTSCPGCPSLSRASSAAPPSSRARLRGRQIQRWSGGRTGSRWPRRQTSGTYFLVIPCARPLACTIPHGPFFGGGTLDASLRPGGGVWGCLGSKLWLGGTWI